MKLENLFVITAVLFGLAFALITPPFQSPDEYNHFFRAYGLSKGIIFPTKIKIDAVGKRLNLSGWDNERSRYLVGSRVSQELVHLMLSVNTDLPGKTSHKQNVTTLLKHLQTPNQPLSNEPVFVSYPNTALYSPVPYLPAIVAIKFAELLNFGYLYAMYFVRFMYLATYIFILYYAIKLASNLKITLYLLCLMPMSLFLGMSTSVDGVAIGLAFLTYSLIVRQYSNYSNKGYLLLLVVSVLLGLTKSAYFVLPFFSFILIFAKPKNLEYKAFIPGIFSTLSFAIWSLATANLYIPLIGGAEPAEQVNLFIAKPLSFFVTLYITLSGMRMYLINQFVGNFGWLDTPLNKWSCVAYIVVLLFSVFVGSERIKLAQRGILAFITLSAITSAALFVYASWSPVGFPEIQGLVGRYFIPISIFGLASVQFPIRRFNNKYVVSLILFSNVGLLIYSVYTIVLRYYVN